MMMLQQAFLTQIIPEDFTSKFNDAAFVMKVQIELKKFGYTSLSESGVWDKAINLLLKLCNIILDQKISTEN
jgi:hypothetical protein